MNTITTIDKVAVYFLAFICVAWILSTTSYAYHINTTFPNDISVYDLWNVSTAEAHAKQLVDLLNAKGYVSDKVTLDDVDYICCMAAQLTSHYEDISPGTVIAMIAIESRFNTNAKSESGARGLMQLIPGYHQDRLIQFLEDDERYSRDLFYDPLYNIMTGLDYLNERLIATETDNLPYALMQYNQGPASAYKTYVVNQKTSHYAMEVIELSVELDAILKAKPPHNEYRVKVDKH